MEEKGSNRWKIFYESRDADCVPLVEEACGRTLDLLRERYSLQAPDDLCVYIMTSWRQYLSEAMPLLYKIVYAPAFPFLAYRTGRLWPYVGGWEIRFGRRHTLGVKPPRLLEAADKSVGDRLFLREPDLQKKMQHLVCHELTHAVTTRLGLPHWLKEGIAMRAVDWYTGADTVRPESLLLLQETPTGRRGRNAQWTGLLRMYARGYWLVRLAEEKHPEVIRQVLAGNQSPHRVEDLFRSAFSLPSGDFWRAVTSHLLEEFGDRIPAKA
jgi:hypothetical protein